MLSGRQWLRSDGALGPLLWGDGFPRRQFPFHTMSIIPLTLAVSLCLVFTFVVFFLRENARRFSSAERDSLLPLNEETPRRVRVGTSSAAAAPLSNRR